MSWRSDLGGRRAWAWGVPLAVVVANLVWLASFGSGSRVRSADLERRLARARSEHAEQTSRLALLERLWMAASDNRDRAAALYGEQFATESARFTDTIRELKKLAERAGLDPGAISYPRELLEEYGVTRRSFVFSVGGSYAALRTFLHLVELSPSFFIVEQIDVGESGRALGIRIRLSTLFGTAEAVAVPGDAEP